MKNRGNYPNLLGMMLLTGTLERCPEWMARLSQGNKILNYWDKWGA